MHMTYLLTYLITYLLRLRFLSEHRATSSLHLSRPLAIRRAPCQLTPISFRSSLKVLRHVFFGLPLFRLPSSGSQYIAVWAGHSLCRLRTWPTLFHLLVVTINILESLHACSPRHLFICDMVAPRDAEDCSDAGSGDERHLTCGPSWPFSSTSHTHNLPWWSQWLCTLKLMVVDYHIGRSRWKMDAAFRSWRVHPALNRRRLTCSYQDTETSRRNPRSIAWWGWEDAARARSSWPWSSRSLS